ncbi:processed acidic surface protein [Bacillus suaedae]|uniref:Processed acidic surface protein n=1 Tax=Halalkalibacter suaedae TaxID=2822140 RepID=A0A940WWB4_9BACI|nr:processed acidic surface protein [Bacillus suaedae]MBP3953521.1 processed acidic surface protein [Bacillus suaedae]
MRKQFFLYSVVATLTFGSTAITAQAIEPDEASEHFPAVIDWSETDWNSYLDENYGTSLNDYDTVLELEADIGPPVDLAALGNADTSDPNVLDLIEKYDMSTEELVIFLDSYDNVENIYFLADLENALEQDGFVLVEDGENTEEPVNEPATEEEQPEQDTEEPTSEQESEYAFDMTQLENVYLTPLGWTQEEFSTYVEDNYDKPLSDFESFEALESTVGPVLTDENLQDLLNSYGLSPEEYRQLLADYGEVPEDYYFVYELTETLDYYTSDEADNADTETGAEMPETATNSVLMTMIGLGAAATGACIFFRRRPLGEK